MNNVHFSIICPVYNSSKSLNRAIDSVIKQSYKNWELILVDDGSTDGSEKICDLYSKNDNRILVIHQSNHGQAYSRMIGLKECCGDYVLFLDSDDYFEMLALETLEKEIISTRVDAILFNARIVDSKNNRAIYSLEKNNCFNNKKSIMNEYFGKRIAGYFWTSCFKKELFKISDEIITAFSQIKYSEDLFLIYHLIDNNVTSLITIPKTLYNYVVSDSSITHTQTAAKVKDRFYVFNYVYSKIYNMHKIALAKETKATIGWTYLSYLMRSAKEYDFSYFKRICADIRKSFVYKKMKRFKKDRFNTMVHFLFKFKMYKKAYSIIRSN